ncbi:LysR family transcriptional regulator, partial [Pseudomonas sp. FW305-17]
SDFLERFPQVQLEVMLLNRRVDLVNEGIDVALRVRELGDEDPLLVTRRLRQAQMLMVASPGFLVGREINHPEDLKSLPVLGALEADRMV